MDLRQARAVQALHPQRRLQLTWTPTRHIGVLFVPFETRVTPTRMFHRAAYGYDVNSPEFKEWQESQMAQYKQYYASQGYTESDAAAAAAGAAAAAAAPAPPPSEPAPLPPPPA